MDEDDRKRLVVIGGGAAGFFCAVNAAKLIPSLRVTILEKTNKLLSKVRISGGGRCNVTHACFDINEMIRKYPRGGNFLKKSFHQFFTTDTIQWFKERGIALKTEPDGRMFPVTDSSATIIDCLMQEARRYGVEIALNAEVLNITRNEDQFMIELSGSRVLKPQFVCVACGGYSKSEMFEWIRRTGHRVEEPVPSLFTFNISDHGLTQLMGIAIPDASVKIVKSKLAERGPVLITHWGLSGPAILRLSAWGARELAAGTETGSKGWQFSVVINWAAGYHDNSLKEKLQELRVTSATQKIINKSPIGLPMRLWQFLCERSGITENARWADLPSKMQNLLVKNVVTYELEVKGKTTFKEEFVTAGGVILSEIDAHSMESRVVPNVFFAGEVMNVDGITGGFNFQHAWTSGWIAAKAISEKLGEA